MVDVSRKDALVASLLSELAAICDRGYALAIHIRYTRPTLLYQAYDQAWVDHYSEKGYMLSDPTVHWGLANVGSMPWNDLIGIDSEGIIATAVNHGLINGWTYSVGEPTSRSIGSMTRSTPFSAQQREQCCAIIDEIHEQTGGFDTFAADQQDRLRRLI